MYKMTEGLVQLKMEEEAASFLRAMADNWILTIEAIVSSELESTLGVLCFAKLPLVMENTDSRAGLTQIPILS